MMSKYSPEIEEYLELFVRFENENTKIQTGEVAKKLKISPASVSEMLKKMELKNLVVVVPYKEAKLTNEGRKIGRSILSKHRVIEKFLSLIGIKRNIHEKACVMEHSISDDVEKAINKVIENPAFKIIVKEEAVTLDKLEDGTTCRVLFIIGGSLSTKRLADLGLVPNTELKILHKSKFGPLELNVRNNSIAIGRGLCKKVYVVVKK